jgi:cytochrome c-type biogenesis protein CcmE
MTKKRAIQVSATVVIICGAIGYLLASGIASGEYYKHVDEVLANPSALQGKRLQVHGRVVKGSIQRRVTGTLPEYKFAIQNNGKFIEAHYAGIVPDTFKDEAEVVCKGKLTPAGQLEISPDGVLAKCPSKYDAKKGEAAGSGTN